MKIFKNIWESHIEQFGTENSDILSLVDNCVNSLLETDKDAEEPVLLYGQVQSGKTGVYNKIIALAFDKGFDIVILLTKNSNLLEVQTLAREEKDFYHFQYKSGQPYDSTVIVDNVVELKKKTKKAARKREVLNCGKNLIVCKKQYSNLEALIKLLSSQCHWMLDRKVLIVDDEADFASRNYISAMIEKYYVENISECRYELSFRNLPICHQNLLDFPEYFKLSGEALKLARVAELIDKLRDLPDFCRYLQVTATPSSMLLQPNGKVWVADKGMVRGFKPRNAFIIEPHSKYAGGKDFFFESENEDSPFYHTISLFGEYSLNYLKNAAIPPQIEAPDIFSFKYKDLTKMLVGYILGTTIRSLQEESIGNSDFKSSAVIHIQIEKNSHEDIYKIVDRILKLLLKQFKDYPNNSIAEFNSMLDGLYTDFKYSYLKSNLSVCFPTLHEIIESVLSSFDFDMHVVNSDNKSKSFIDETTGKIRLSKRANIFIGGSSLDRGLTFDNLLSFFYGRFPKKFQMDTVLQHARFFGSRSKEDISVTRLHVVSEIFKQMKNIFQIDQCIREQIENGALNTPEGLVFFPEYNKVNYTSCTKIALSDIVTVRPLSRVLPIAMHTIEEEFVLPINGSINCHLRKYGVLADKSLFPISNETAKTVLDLIHETYIYGPDPISVSHIDDIKTMKTFLDIADTEVILYYTTGHKVKRTTSSGELSRNPLGGDVMQQLVAEAAEKNKPVMGLVLNSGAYENGWNGADFYWPIIIPPPSLNIQYAKSKQRGFR